MRDKNENSYEKVNVISKPKNSNKGKQSKRNSLGPKKNQEKFKKPKKEGFFVCGKPSHYAKDCRFKKTQKPKVNSLEENDEIVTIVNEINTIQGKVSGWWYDTCVTVHLCYEKSLFKTYREVNDGK